MWKYIGNGAYVPGIPARDLTDTEAESYGTKAIRASGLYQHVKKGGGSENKVAIPKENKETR